MVTMRSSSGINRESVFSMVVFPEPDPPEITMLSRASTQPLMKSSMPVVKVWFFSRSSVETLAVTADGDHRADQRERRNHRADARAIGQARVHNRRRIVDAAANGVDNAIDDHAHVRVILEPDIGLHQASGPFHVHVVEAVDQDVADGWVLEQRFQRAQPEDFVQNLFDQLFALAHGHGEGFVYDELLHHDADLPADAFFVEVLELFRRQQN